MPALQLEDAEVTAEGVERFVLDDLDVRSRAGRESDPASPSP